METETMRTTRFTVGLLMLIPLLPGASPVWAGEKVSTEAKARAIHERAVTIDSHVDIPGSTYATPALDPGAPSTVLKCDLTKMERGGLDGVFLGVFVGQGPLEDAGYRRAWDQAMAKFDAIQRLTTQMHPGRCAVALSPEDVTRIVKTGKRAIMTGIENGYPMGLDLANLRRFHELGARYITLAHGANNQLADSSSAREPLNNGLSEIGRKTVVEMNRLGIMVDVSHISDKSFRDVLAVTRAPIIASHSGCRAIADSDRNLTDEQLRALAKNGGVIQTVALGAYLRKENPARRDAVTKLREELGLPTGARGGWRGAGRPDSRTSSDTQNTELQKKMEQYRERMKAIDARYPPATLGDFVDHIEHAVKVAGIDHVGIGTDFDGGGGIQGFTDESESPNVTIELVRRGYNEAQIRKIWGGNLLRVWRDVESVARGMQKGK